MWHRIRSATVCAVLLLCALQVYFLVAHPKQDQLHQSYMVVPTTPVTRTAATQKPASDFDTQTFTLTGGPQPVDVTFSAPLQNTWVDVDVQLVNSGSGEARADQTELSYYSGYDSDGAWSEGSRIKTVRFASVVPGTYFLRVEPEADPKAPPLSLAVEVQSGGLFWSNFFLSAALLLWYPAWVLYRRHAFEQSRWGDSDFSAPSKLNLTGSDDD
jgi:hypothetical protein